MQRTCFHWHWCRRVEIRAGVTRRRPRYTVTISCLFLGILARELCRLGNVELLPFMLGDRTAAVSHMLDGVALLHTDIMQIATVMDEVMLERESFSAVQRAAGLLVLLEAGLLEPRPPTPSAAGAAGAAGCAGTALREARRLARYSTASYGWTMLNSLFLPGQPNSVSSVRDVLSSYGAAADSADLNERLALRHSGAAELLCAQWASSSSPAYVPAHFVAVDLHLRALVVSVRGTGHPLDVAADLQIWPERYGVRGRAHAGMAAAARGLRDALLPRLRGWLAEPRFDRFRLVVVGHSLGGGTAALLALELASALRPTRVRALAFATPAVLDRASARAAAEVVTSFVGGADLVPTLCVGSLRALGRACRAAYTALQAHGFAALAERAQAQFAGGFGLAQQARGNWTGQHELGGVLRDSAFRRDLKRAMAAAASNRTKGARGGRGRDSTLAVRASTGEAADDDDDVLYPAGLICHLQSRPPGPPPGPACESRAVERESFGVVRISPQAFVDHLPARYEQLLDMCAPGDVVPTVESAATVFT